MKTRDKVISENLNRYYISEWGEGYFGINSKGNISIRPEPEAISGGPEIDMMEVIDDIKDQGISLPVVIRFHDILRDKIEELNETFNNVIDELEYKGNFLGVYPIKVNQMREVVEEVLSSGKQFNFGLEAGSKGELLAVLAMNRNESALTIVNGFKDKEVLKLAMLGRKLERKIIVVIEKFSELKDAVKVAKELNVEPYFGLRVRLSCGGSGKWANSSGASAKFGLSTSEVLESWAYLKENNLESSLKLIHFHIGSQVTDIYKIKDAITEATRFYIGLEKLGAPLEYMDVGGGLGVDYDGKSSVDTSSKNYNLHAYASDIVYTIKQLCDEAEINHPTVVSESGRFITAHHSCIVTNVIGSVGETLRSFDEDKINRSATLVKNMYDILHEVDATNLEESYNDAVYTKEQVNNAFNLGVLSLEDKASSEGLFWKINKKIKNELEDTHNLSDAFKKMIRESSKQYICNFSIFQSLPDSWAIDQLMPVAPIHRLDEEPVLDCTLVDITCDSDGKISNFIDGGVKKETIKLHTLDKENYYIGFFMTGAYQDVMGDMHNLFGRLNEVHVYVDDDDPDDFYIEEVVQGSRTRDVLSEMQYDHERLSSKIKKSVDRLISQKKIIPREGVKLVDYYESCLNSYTYLS